MEQARRIHIDIPASDPAICIGDFLVAVGKTKTNSVYHVANVIRVCDRPAQHARRVYLEVLPSELRHAIRRDRDTRLIPFKWNPRFNLRGKR